MLPAVFHRLFYLLGNQLRNFREGRFDSFRILSSGLGHIGTAAAASSYESGDPLDQVSGMDALL